MLNESVVLAPTSSDRQFIARFFARLDWLFILGAATIGCALLVYTEGAFPLQLAVVSLSVCGAVTFARCILLHDDISALLVMATTLAMGYGVGTLNSLANGYADYMSLLQLTYARPDQITEVIAWMLLLFSLMYFMHRVMPTRLLPPLAERSEEDTTVVLIMSVLLACVVVVFVASGKIGIQLDVSAEEGSSTISASSAMVITALAPVAAVAVYYAMGRQGLVRYLMLASSMSMLLVQATQGRRVFIYTGVCCLISYASATRTKKLLTLRNAVLVIVLALAAMTASKLFYSMRQATIDMGKSKNIPALIERGVTDLLNKDRGDFDQQFQENQDTRTFIIGYLAEVNAAVKTHATQLGGVFVLGVVSAIPTVIWPGKWYIMSVGSEEALTHPDLGMPVWDASNTILTAGLCDFGLAGFFVYPIMVALAFTLGVRLVRRLYMPARLVFGFGALYILLSVETAFAGYTASLRELISLTLMFQVATWCVHAWYVSVRPFQVARVKELEALRCQST
jgi:hypothetical protein